MEDKCQRGFREKCDKNARASVSSKKLLLPRQVIQSIHLQFLPFKRWHTLPQECEEKCYLLTCLPSTSHPRTQALWGEEFLLPTITPSGPRHALGTHQTLNRYSIVSIRVLCYHHLPTLRLWTSLTKKDHCPPSPPAQVPSRQQQSWDSTAPGVLTSERTRSAALGLNLPTVRNLTRFGDG